MPSKTCPCGSDLSRENQYDARGIFLCFTCPKCETSKLAKYRPEVLNDSQYECDEQIDEDY